MKMIMNTIKCVVAMTTATLVVGCKNPPPPSSNRSDEVQNLVPRQDVVLSLKCESIEDDNFVLHFDENMDKCAFSLKSNSHATLADLANFAMQTCWKKRLSRKFTEKNSEPLTDNDVKLVEFCLDTHLMFLDTLTVAMLNDLTQSDRIYYDYSNNKSSFGKPYQSIDVRADESIESKLDKDIDSIYNDLKENFLSSTNSPIRNCIRDWGQKFQSENAQEANWLSVYSGIYEQMPGVDIDKIKKEHKSWLWMPEIVRDYDRRDIVVSKQPDNGVATIETAEAWSVMESMTRRYLYSLNSIYISIRKYQSNLELENSSKLEKSQYIIRKKGANVNAYNRFFRGALYDMPLAFYALRGYAGIYANWHWYGDNEEAMFNVAKYMVMGIRGIEMIVNAKSLYSVHAYNSVVSFLKNKLSDAEFKTLQTDTKMYHVEISNEATESNKCVEFSKTP